MSQQPEGIPRKRRALVAVLAGAVGVIALIVIISTAAAGGKSSPSPTYPPITPEIGAFTPQQQYTATETPTPETSTPETSSDEPAPQVDTWEFKVDTTGSGISSVTYMKPGFNIAQDTAVHGKHWSATVRDTYDQDPNMNAQNSGGGTITCTILHNGQVVASNSSKGSYAVVSCQ